MLLEQAVESLLLASDKFAGLDARVIDTEERVDVVHRLGADVRELLDLGGDVLDLDESRTVNICDKEEKTVDVRTSSSVRVRPSCSTRLLTAFQPVRR